MLGLLSHRHSSEKQPNILQNIVNKMCFETQMPPYEANSTSRGGHHRQNQNSRSRCQNLRYQHKGLVTRNMHMKYESPITYNSKDMANVKVFEKWVKLQGLGQKLWYQKKALIIRNTYTKYESSITYHSKDMVNVKVFEKWV
jgi:hypothetical protein